MDEYINTNINPADYIEVWEVEDKERGKQLVMAVDDLKYLPPADVQPVVFCKDCENWVEEVRAGHKDLGNYVCACAEWSNNEDGHMVFTGPGEYCSRGIRRESDETD